MLFLWGVAIKIKNYLDWNPAIVKDDVTAYAKQLQKKGPPKWPLVLEVINNLKFYTRCFRNGYSDYDAYLFLVFGLPGAGLDGAAGVVVLLTAGADADVAALLVPAAAARNLSISVCCC